MPPPSVLLPSLLVLAVPAMASDAPQGARAGGASMTQFSIHERIIIRVPAMPVGRVAMAPPVVWKEKKGPHCVAAQTLAGAVVTGPRAVDLVLQGGKRLRAKLDGDCRPLDFYAGFYLRPAADGMVCADRDSIRVRSGASCGIDTFRTLVPAR